TRLDGTTADDAIAFHPLTVTAARGLRRALGEPVRGRAVSPGLGWGGRGAAGVASVRARSPTTIDCVRGRSRRARSPVRRCWRRVPKPRLLEASGACPAPG